MRTLLFFCILSASANAGTFVVGVVGEVDSVINPPVGFQVDEGEEVGLIFHLDTDIAGVSTIDGTRYEFPLYIYDLFTTTAITIEAHTYTLFVRDGDSEVPSDELRLIAEVVDPSDGLKIITTLHLVDSTGTAFSSEEQPIGMSLSDFDNTGLSVTFEDAQGFAAGEFSAFPISGLLIVPIVPEPSSFALLSVGLLAFTYKRRRKQ